jgi:hypothetical protein
MGLQMGAPRDALLAANVPPDKAAAAAEEAASYETRLSRIDAKLTVAMWAGGLLFAAVLTSQAAFWIGMGRISGQLATISAQANHIEQLLAQC